MDKVEDIYPLRDVPTPIYWRHRENICAPDLGVHLGCAHANDLPADGVNVVPRPPRTRPRVCRRGLHDLDEPGNWVPSSRECRPCKTEYQVQRRRRCGRPSRARPRRPLDPETLAYLRGIAACRSCGARPGDGRFDHADDCRGVPDGGE